MKYYRGIILAIAMATAATACTPITINVGPGHDLPSYRSSYSLGVPHYSANSNASNLSLESAQRHSDMNSLTRIRLHNAMTRLRAGPPVPTRPKKRRKIARRYF